MQGLPTIGPMLLLSALLLSSCNGWSNSPKRLEADYGQSVRQMRMAQTLDPARAAHPDLRLPETMEGEKADQIFERLYRQPTGSPEQVRKPLVVGPGASGISSGGGMR